MGRTFTLTSRTRTGGQSQPRKTITASAAPLMSSSKSSGVYQAANYSNNGTASNTQISSNFGGDWTQGNSNFSFDNLKNQAKELAQQQLEISRQQMQNSYEFREKEKASNFGYDTQSKNQDAEIRSREANQRFGFEEALQKMQNQQQLTMQSNKFNQQRNMFNMQDAAKNAQVNSARNAANRLYFGGRRKV